MKFQILNVQAEKEDGKEAFDDHEDWSKFVIENNAFFTQFDK
jgi:hypothetical protein